MKYGLLISLFIITISLGNDYFEEVLVAPGDLYFGQLYGQGLSSNGDDLLISSMDGLHFYTYSEFGWINSQNIERPEGVGTFGLHTQVQGNHAFVSAENDGGGKVYTLEKENGMWTITGFLSVIDENVYDFGANFVFLDNIALIRAISIEDQSEVAIVYLFQLSGEEWGLQTSFEGDDVGFGLGLGISDNSLYIGDTYSEMSNGLVSGCVHHYQVNEFNEINELNNIRPNLPIENSMFGMKIIAENQKLYIGAPGDNNPINYCGSMYEFEKIENNWIESSIFIPQDGENGDSFGEMFDVLDDTIIISAINNSDAGLGAGKVYIFKFEPETGGWYELKVIHSSDHNPGDWFGSFATLNNDFAFISSPFRNNWEGAVYIYDPHDNSLHSNFVADVRNGEGPVTVQFTSGAQGNPTAWEWDFNNDGTIDSVEENPEFTYTIDGIYSVSLTVYDEETSDFVLKENYIQVTSDVIYGDLDSSGSLDVNDLVIFVAIILGDLEPTDTQLLAGDVNYSGEIDILDVVIAVDVILGLE